MWRSQQNFLLFSLCQTEAQRHKRKKNLWRVKPSIPTGLLPHDGLNFREDDFEGKNELEKKLEQHFFTQDVCM
jgi:hypothetical protein